METGREISTSRVAAGKAPTPVRVRNFGHNLDFRPNRLVRPETEQEVLDVLAAARTGTIRVVGSRHAWSPGIESRDTLLDMSSFRGIEVVRAGEAGAGSGTGGQAGPPKGRDGVGADALWVRAGAGARIRDVLAHLDGKGLTLPSIGLIAEQTVAGAIATGTHGSGGHSLSHYVKALRIACFDGQGGSPVMRHLESGDDLRAGRCAMGCMGVVTTVWMECVPQYLVEERAQWAGSLEEVLDWEKETPLQQFYLIPESWRLLGQRRRVVESAPRWASLYRTYWFVLIDVALHVAIKLAAAVFRSRRLVRTLYRHLVPALVFPRWTCVDRSDRQLTMRHELFRHLELELFVQRSRLPDAMALVRGVLRTTAHPEAAIDEKAMDLLEAAGEGEEWARLRGTYQHHYPICVRRVRPDDTLISMASGEGRPLEDWYAVSLITYRSPRDPFYGVAHLLARVVSRQLGGRIHWGKWFPLDGGQVARSYPALSRFRACCIRADPDGVFRNEFVEQALFAPYVEPVPQSGHTGTA